MERSITCGALPEGGAGNWSERSGRRFESSIGWPPALGWWPPWRWSWVLGWGCPVKRIMTRGTPDNLPEEHGQAMTLVAGPGFRLRL